MPRKICEFELSESDEASLAELQKRIKQDEIIKQLKNDASYIFQLSNEQILVRFLFAREGNVDNTYKMWQNWAKWYLLSKPHLITKGEIQEEIDANKAKWIGIDLKGNPCLVVTVRNHEPLTETIPRTTKFFYYLMEKGVKLAEKTGTYRITVIWDGKGFKKSQLNSAFIEFLKIATKLLMDCYPNRLSAVLLTDPNFLVRLGYGILKPFLSPVITNKIHQIPTSDLLKFIDKSQLSQEHGGELQEGQLPHNHFESSVYSMRNSQIYKQQQQPQNLEHSFHESMNSEIFLSLENNSNEFFDSSKNSDIEYQSKELFAKGNNNKANNNNKTFDHSQTSQEIFENTKHHKKYEHFNTVIDTTQPNKSCTCCQSCQIF